MPRRVSTTLRMIRQPRGHVDYNTMYALMRASTFDYCNCVIKPAPQQQQCRSNVRLHRSGLWSIRQCCFDIVAGVDRTGFNSSFTCSSQSTISRLQRPQWDADARVLRDASPQSHSMIAPPSLLHEPAPLSASDEFKLCTLMTDVQQRNATQYLTTLWKPRW